MSLTYDEAFKRLQDIRRAESPFAHPLCRTELLTHGLQTPRVIVLLHGFTNCPHQFHQLALQLYTHGNNVLKVRLPRHGLADRLTDDLAQLTAAEILDHTETMLNIATGLGAAVTAVGFSLGGVIAGWAAQHRSDLDHVVLIAPALGIRPLPAWSWCLGGKLLTFLPNIHQWWNPVLKQKAPGPQHAYPRFASRAAGVLLQLGCQVRDDAQHHKPRARAITVITNPNDPLVAPSAIEQTLIGWRKQGALVNTYTLPAEWALIHDFIDPTQVEQQVDRVYPQLIGWINGSR